MVVPRSASLSDEYMEFPLEFPNHSNQQSDEPGAPSISHGGPHLALHEAPRFSRRPGDGAVEVPEFRLTVGSWVDGLMLHWFIDGEFLVN